MYEIYVVCFTFFTSILINFFLLKKSFLLDKKYSSHKSFVNKNEIPLSGGLIIFLSIIAFYETEFYTFKIVLLLIFLIGLFSDLNIMSSPAKRIAAQTVVIFFFLYISQVHIRSISLEFIDHYLQNTYLGYVFSLFCFVILINGTNFMDGVNTLVIGYYFIVILIILNLASNSNLELNFYLAKIISATLFVLFIFNFFGKLFLGDGGSYLIAFVFGYLLINFFNANESISPYFITCILWYPAYENLFSITRKIIKKKSPVKADNKHLHQLLFYFIKAKLAYSNNVINTLTALIINFFNLMLFLQAARIFNNTAQLIILILISIVIYNLSYYYLMKIIYQKKN